MTTRLNQSQCPSCNRKLDAASPLNAEHAEPKAGDLTICMYCTAFLKFTDTLEYAILTSEEIFDLDAHLRHEMIVARRTIKAMEI